MGFGNREHPRQWDRFAWFEDDVRVVAGAGERLDSVIVPKAESPDDLQRAEALLRVCAT